MDERMTTERTDSGPSDSQLLAMYERMLLIRRMEERLRDDNAAGKLPGAVHLYIGQEAVVVGLQMTLRPGDQIITGSYQVIRTIKNGATVKVDNKAPVVATTTS